MSSPPTRLAVAVAIGSGGAVALQAFVNGRLGGSLGSAELAAALNNLIGLLLLGVLGFAAGAFTRGARRVRATPGRPAWWHFLGGPAGALFVLSSTLSAPEIGVAVLTVAIVCGQTAGSLAVDAAGLAPGGHRPLTAPRIVGAALAVGAVVLAASTGRGELQLGLVALCVAAGAGLAVQQAANGQLAARSGEPVVAATVNFVIGAVILVVVALPVTGGRAPQGYGAPAGEWIGGFLGVAIVLTAAWTVSTLGALRLTLAVVAGQSAGALLIDLLAPAAGEAVTAGTVAGVALTLAAVLVSGRGVPPPR